MKKTKRYIYKIITSGGTGTGFKIAGYDFVITNYHVVEGSKTVAVEDIRQKRHLAQVVMVNPEVDLAFLNVDRLKNERSTIKIDKNYQITDRQKVFINGFPFGMPFTVTEGIVSSSDQPMGGRRYIQTDAAVNPGNSGGPMLDENGYLVGVTTSKFTQADNVGFGIKFSDVLKELNDYQFTDNKYRLKCNSCDNYIDTESEFCPVCGNSIDSSVFEEFEPSHFAVFVEEALQDLGINPVLCRAGRDYWVFYQGSASIRIFALNNEYLYATAPINNMPKKNLEPLLEYINSDKVSPYQMGIYENKIFLSYRTHLSDIYTAKRQEIKKHLTEMVLTADELDDYLIYRFGCEYSIDSKSVNENLVRVVKNETQETDILGNPVDYKPENNSFISRLKLLKELFDLELITGKEYSERKKEILKEI